MSKAISTVVDDSESGEQVNPAETRKTKTGTQQSAKIASHREPTLLQAPDGVRYLLANVPGEDEVALSFS
jgi:hypothetical protein